MGGDIWGIYNNTTKKKKRENRRREEEKKSHASQSRKTLAQKYSNNARNTQNNTQESILVYLSSYQRKKKKTNNKEKLDAGYFQITIWGCFRNNESRPAAVEKVLSGYWLRNLTRSKCQFSARAVVSVYVLRQPRVLRVSCVIAVDVRTCVGAIDAVTKVHLFCSFAQPLEPSRSVFFIRKKALTKRDLWCCYDVRDALLQSLTKMVMDVELEAFCCENDGG